MTLTAYSSKFLLLALFACAVGMLCANAVTLKDDISDRCLLIPAGGDERTVKLRKISHDAVVSGGFGVTASFFALLSVLSLYLCEDISGDRKVMYAVLLILSAVGFATVGGIQLARVDNPQARCGRQDSDGDYKMPDIEIAATIVSGLTIVGLATPLLELWFSK